MAGFTAVLSLQCPTVPIGFSTMKAGKVSRLSPNEEVSCDAGKDCSKDKW